MAEISQWFPIPDREPQSWRRFGAVSAWTAVFRLRSEVAYLAIQGSSSFREAGDDWHLTQLVSPAKVMVAGDAGQLEHEAFVSRVLAVSATSYHPRPEDR